MAKLQIFTEFCAKLWILWKANYFARLVPY